MFGTSGLTWQEDVGSDGGTAQAVLATQELFLGWEGSVFGWADVSGSLDVSLSSSLLDGATGGTTGTAGAGATVVTGAYDLEVGGEFWGVAWSSALEHPDPGFSPALRLEGVHAFALLSGYRVEAVSGVERLDEEGAGEDDDEWDDDDDVPAFLRSILQVGVTREGGTYGGSSVSYRVETPRGGASDDLLVPDYRSEAWKVCLKAHPARFLTVDGQASLGSRVDEFGAVPTRSYRASVAYSGDELGATLAYSLSQTGEDLALRAVEGLEGGVTYRSRSGGPSVRLDYGDYVSIPTEARETSRFVSTELPLGRAMLQASYRSRERPEDSKEDVEASLSGRLGNRTEGELRYSRWMSSVGILEPPDAGSWVRSGGSKAGVTLTYRPARGRSISVSYDWTAADPGGGACGGAGADTDATPGTRGLVRYQTDRLDVRLVHQTHGGETGAGAGAGVGAGAAAAGPVTYVGLGLKQGRSGVPVELSALYKVRATDAGWSGHLVSAGVKWTPGQRFDLSATYEEADPDQETEDGTQQETNSLGLQLAYRVGGERNYTVVFSYQKSFGLSGGISERRVSLLSLSWEL